MATSIVEANVYGVTVQGLMLLHSSVHTEVSMFCTFTPQTIQNVDEFDSSWEQI